MGWFSTLKIEKQFVFKHEMCNMGFYINPCADELFVSSFHSFEAGISCFKWK